MMELKMEGKEFYNEHLLQIQVQLNQSVYQVIKSCKMNIIGLDGGIFYI